MLSIMAMLLGLILILKVLCNTVRGDSILLLPIMYKSLIKEQLVIGETLVNRGHVVYMLIESKMESFVNKSPVKTLIYTEPPWELTYKSYTDKISQNAFEDPHTNPYTYERLEAAIERDCNRDCWRLLHNRAIMEKIKKLDFDIAIVQESDPKSCLFLVPYHLSIPYIYMFASVESILLGLPAYIRHIRCDSLIHESVGFVRLLRHVLDIVKAYMLQYEEYGCVDRGTNQQLLSTFAPGVNSIWEIIEKSELFLVTRDHMLDPPCHTLPNTVFLPGITPRPGRPLPADLDQLLASGDKWGLVSFGSSVDNIPYRILRRILIGLGQVKHLRFLLRTHFEDISPPIKSWIPQNVFTVGWIPQNDVLAHPNMKIFITHCGNNGQYEALYHGIPMVGIPLFYDQHHNCDMLLIKNLGRCLNFSKLSGKLLSQTIEEVLLHADLNKNVKKSSSILQYQGLPREMAANWIEHVIKFGGEHLRPAGQMAHIHETFMHNILEFFCACLLPLVNY